ncbi:MAG TPA: glucose 1-dehydrogenase [Verrucomicrobiae bacterium]|nr:glucose 1-dehydrogenase [Verrucomicrobiae bacterium]
MGHLSGKVAVVTGASKGIGAEIARAFGLQGASVVVNYASDEAGAQRVVQAIDQAGGKAIAVRADVSKASDVKALFDETKRAFGAADILVNNAGVYAFGRIEDVTEAEFRRQFDTNVLGVLLATQQAVAHFGDRGGRVINVSSVVSQLAPPNSSVYSGTKGALDTITRVLASELGPRNIRVNAINPGGVDTEGAQSAGIVGSEFEKAMVAQTPFGRLGKPSDIAPLAVFLASDDAGWVTGELVRASGGMR